MLSRAPIAMPRHFCFWEKKLALREKYCNAMAVAVPAEILCGQAGGAD